MNKTFDVFLSHNSKDKPAVREIAKALRDRGLNVWLDEWELVPGRPWQEALEAVLQTTQSSAVLVGKDGIGPWEDVEMRACLSHFVRRKLPVIPVLLPNAPQEPELPFFLQGFTWVDLREGLTEEGLDRLQWGITGRRPDNSRTPSRIIDAAPEARSVTAAPEQSFIEPITGIRFLWIPGGRFRMGGKLGWLNRLNRLFSVSTEPVHWVRVSPFWLGETPVTNLQYAVFLEKTGAEEPKFWRDQKFSSPDKPVVGVRWGDAVSFCLWLSEVSGRQIFLPSEAQWEFAARGTDGRSYPWGNEPPNLADFGQTDQPQTVPVGSFQVGRGPFGTLDQTGNISEWCQDVWDRDAYVKRAAEALNPIVVEPGAGEKEQRVVRGRSWWASAGMADLQSFFRQGISPEDQLNWIGFRVAATNGPAG